MKKLLLALLLALAATPAGAVVNQSGSVTPNHAACWTSTGIIKDCGPATAGVISSLGITASGPSFCIQSDLTTAAGYQRLCLGTTTAGGAVITTQNIGTATAQGISFLINGTASGFPTVQLPVTVNDLACFADTSGTLKDCTGSIVSVLTPLIIGGTAANSSIELRATSGAGVGAELVKITAGNNGGTLISRFSTSGVSIGAANVAADSLLTIMMNTAAAVTPPLSDTLFHLMGEQGHTIRQVFDAYGTNAGSTIEGRLANGSNTAKTAVVANDQIMSIGAHGWDGSSYSSVASITFDAEQNFSPTNHSTRIRFLTFSPDLALPFGGMTLGHNAQNWPALGIGIVYLGTFGELNANDLAFEEFSGNARSIGINRSSTSGNPGTPISLGGGSAKIGATNANGGNVVLSPGKSTGSGTGKILLYGFPGVAAATVDNTVVQVAEIAAISASSVRLTLGIAGTSLGSIALTGNTSGTVIITAQATAGSPTLTLPNASGTFAVSASGNLSLNATTGALTISDTPAFTTFITTPLVIGGTTASSSLTLESTSGAGTTDKIIFKTGSQVQQGQIATDGGWSIGSGTTSLGAGTLIVKATAQIGTTGSNTGTLNMVGTTSGVVAVTVQAAAGTYNFNLPTSAGTSGQPLCSAGGGASPQTYCTLGPAAGGTGIANNAASTLTIAGNFATTFTVTGTTALTLPTSGTLVTTDAAQTLTNKIIAGGSTASSVLTIESTTGAGTTDSIVFLTGSQSTRWTINTSGQLIGSNGVISGGTTTNAVLTLQTTTGAGSGDAILFKTASQVEAGRFSTSGGFGVGITTDPGANNIITRLLQVGLTAVATGTVQFAGITSGLIAVKAQDASGTYNFNLPTTAGTSGQVLTSAGGVAAPMTWSTPGTVTSTVIAAGAGMGTFTGTCTITTTGTCTIVGSGANLPGSVTNDSASAGNVGQIIESVIASPGSSITSATPANVTSISLTAGDWDVWAVASYNAASTTTYTQLNAAVSLTTASLTPVNAGSGETQFMVTFTTGPSTQKVSIPATRVTLAGTTTVYLNTQAVFAISTMTGYGSIFARRRR